MTLDLAEFVPPSLRPSCAAISVGRGCPPACRLAEMGWFERALSAFVASQPCGLDRSGGATERGAAISLWSMYYLAALVVPATAALVCRDRILPVGFGEIGISIDEAGLATFRLADAGCPAASQCGRRFETLVEGHVAPFVALCSARSGLSPRVFWSNAAVMVAWALDELRHVGGKSLPACAEAEALLAGTPGESRLARPFTTHADGARERRVCCLRYRLDGIDDCGTLCPRGRRPERLAPIDTSG